MLCDADDIQLHYAEARDARFSLFRHDEREEHAAAGRTSPALQPAP